MGLTLTLGDGSASFLLFFPPRLHAIFVLFSFLDCAYELLTPSLVAQLCGNCIRGDDRDDVRILSVLSFISASNMSFVTSPYDALNFFSASSG